MIDSVNLNKIGSLIRTYVKQYPVGAFFSCMILLIILIAIFAPVIAPHDHLKGDYTYINKPPNHQYYLGTDQNGRDQLSRIIFGTRATLIVSLIAVGAGTTLGMFFGVISAYARGKVDLISQRLVEVLQAFPDLILAILIMAALKGSLWTVITAIAITRIPFGTRVIRSAALQIREMEYVTAAQAIGASAKRVMFRHILPQVLAPYIVLATAHLGVAIIIEASLGFLGAGVPPPTPTWGNMLGLASLTGLRPSWWLVLFPGIAITVTVMCFNLAGDSLRDALDPRLRGV